MSWRLDENLSSETYQQLVDIAEPLSCAQGAVLISEGDQSRTLFIVESGSLTVSQQAGAGERQLGIIEAGDVVGEIAFIDQRPRSATVTIREDARLLKLGHAEVMHALVRSPGSPGGPGTDSRGSYNASFPQLSRRREYPVRSLKGVFHI
jgi:CRP-like cAMP-binding protein